MLQHTLLVWFPDDHLLILSVQVASGCRGERQGTTKHSVCRVAVNMRCRPRQERKTTLMLILRVHV